MKSKLSFFDFELPKELVAQYPSKERDQSRLMVVHRDTGKIEHRIFADIKEYFEEGDAMILNNTKVFPARLYGRKEKTDARIEVFLLRELNDHLRLWDVMVDPARKIRVGNKLYFANAQGKDVLVAEVLDNTTSRGRTMRFNFNGTNEEFKQVIKELGHTPIPKYLNRDPEEIDKERYQTVFAKDAGAVAAPTAGLHFSRKLLKELELIGVDLPQITLHVGLGTFRSIDVEDLSKHKMDAEYYYIGEEVAEVVNRAKLAEKNVCAIGTTVMRTLESSVTAEHLLRAGEGWTNLFVYPPFDFRIANRMVTNFHMPKTSLVIMTATFAGLELLQEAYAKAIEEKYRFFTYGDAMLIL